jgi:hypothetical protein
VRLVGLSAGAATATAAAAVSRFVAMSDLYKGKSAVSRFG